MKVKKGSQIFLHTEDKPGELARILKIVVDADVNGIAYAGYAREGKGRIMLVTEDNMRLIPILEQAGYEVREELVALVTDTDSKGSGLAIARRLAEAGVNLSGAYATSAGGEYLTILQSDDVDGIIAALQ